MDWRDILSLFAAAFSLAVFVAMLQTYIKTKARMLLFFSIAWAIEAGIFVLRAIDHFFLGGMVFHGWVTAVLVASMIFFLIGSAMLVRYIDQVYHLPAWPHKRKTKL